MSGHPPVTMKGLDHVVLRCNDLDSMLCFYQDVLGCPLERSAGNLYQLRAGSSLIDFIPRQEPISHRDSGAFDHVCFALVDPNWEEILKHLESHGVDAGEPAQRYGADGMGLSVYIADPEGNTVELKGTPG